MSRASDRAYLEHISDAIAKVQASAAAGESAFLAHADAFDAALRRLQTVAESTQRLSDDLKARHPEVSWNALAGFRNRIVHAYMDVDPGLIWRFIDTDLDPLKRLVDAELGGPEESK